MTLKSIPVDYDALDESNATDPASQCSPIFMDSTYPDADGGIDKLDILELQSKENLFSRDWVLFEPPHIVNDTRIVTKILLRSNEDDRQDTVEARNLGNPLKNKGKSTSRRNVMKNNGMC